jgi:hypothetical protein
VKVDGRCYTSGLGHVTACRGAMFRCGSVRSWIDNPRERPR